jgi:single-strand DNA-binding protein
MKLLKQNTVTVAGHVANINLQNGNYGTYGTITIAVDDGYMQRGQNGQQGQWVDRTYFIDVKVDDNFLKRTSTQIGKGDSICVEGKLVQEKWTDKNSGQERTALRVKGSMIVGHIPVGVKDLAKTNGFLGRHAQTAPQGQPAPQQQAPQQQAPQQYGQQPAPQQNGYANGQAQGGYASADIQDVPF